MDLLEMYFAFYPPVPIRELRKRREDWRCIFGHVSMFGYTADDTWAFLDPQGIGCSLQITHLHDEVERTISGIYARSDLVLSIAPSGRQFRVPIHAPMTCATQCGSLAGIRAWTPWGLRKKLIREGAEVRWERPRENTEGTSGRQGSPLAGAAVGGIGAVPHGPDAGA